MRKNVLAVFDEDFTYADNVTRQLLRVKNNNLQIYLFSSIEKLIAFSQEEEIEYAIIPDEKKEYRDKIKVVFCGYFTSKKLREKSSKEYIYRFQDKNAIYDRILNFNTERTIEECEREVVCRNEIIGFYNPVHRNGQTTCAKQTATILSEYGYKVLYINLEEYSDLYQVTKIKDVEDISDVLFYYRQDKNALKETLSNIVQEQEKYYFIPPAKVGHVLLEIEGTQWIDLFHQLKSMNTYDYLILDMDSKIQSFYEILNLCNIIYRVIRSDSNCRDKIMQFEENVILLEKEDILRKIKNLFIEYIHENEIRQLHKQVKEQLYTCIGQQYES